MIKYRPERVTLSLSMKDEQTFETMDELLQYVYDIRSRISAN